MLELARPVGSAALQRDGAVRRALDQCAGALGSTRRVVEALERRSPGPGATRGRAWRTDGAALSRILLRRRRAGPGRWKKGGGMVRTRRSRRISAVVQQSRFSFPARP